MPINPTRAASRKMPGFFSVPCREIRSALPERNLNIIRWQEDEIRQGNFSSVIEIVHIVAATEFKPSIANEAKRVMAKIEAEQVDLEEGYRQFGFHQKSLSAFFRGVLYELLPRESALPLFAHNYFRFTAWSRINAGHCTMLCFSAAKEAALFAYDLRGKYPDKTDRLFSYRNKRVDAYRFRGYERREFLEKLALLINP